jgi:multiple sugar transport system substrate-binding protein
MKEETIMSTIRKFSATLAAAASLAWLAPSHAFAADKPFADVGKQAPLTMLVPATPWLPSFTKLVEQYEAQTGNVVKLDVNPFAGVLDKARNDVRSGGGTYGALFLDTQWTIEMYEGGFVAPFTDIDPAFTMPKEVLSYGDSGYWNAQKRWRTADGGKLMGFTVLGNVQVWYYRTDVLKAAGLAPPKTWEDVLASCPKIAKPPASYGAVLRAERGNGIRYDWMQWMVERGGSVAKDPENGDFTVTINSPANKAALDQFIEVGKTCGPPNPGSIGQGDVIQLLATGKAMQAQLVLAAWSNLEDPKKSVVVGKLDVVPLPAPAGDLPGGVIGNWNYTIAKGASAEQKKAAIAFARWFLSYDAQYAYAKAGGIPNRTDVLASDLSRDPAYRWMRAYAETLKHGTQELGYVEGPQVEQILGLRLNQAVIGEMSSAKALNLAAQEIRDVFAKNARRTGVGPPLPE